MNPEGRSKTPRDTRRVPIGTEAKRELIRLLNEEVLAGSRGALARTAGIHWRVVNVSAGALRIAVETPHGTGSHALASALRGSILGILDDALPCRRFRAVFSPLSRPTERKTFQLSFWKGLVGHTLEHESLVSEDHQPIRERDASRIAELWCSLPGNLQNGRRVLKPTWRLEAILAAEASKRWKRARTHVARSLVGLLNGEVLWDTRKGYGMYLRISWEVTNVSKTTLTVDVGSTGERDFPTLASNLRNSILGMLGDTLPCRNLRVVQRDGMRGRRLGSQLLPFFRKRQVVGEGAAIVIEENADPYREWFRAPILGLYRAVADAGAFLGTNTTRESRRTT
jgi:hypothetical protein